VVLAGDQMDGALIIDGQVIVPIGLSRFVPEEQALKKKAKAKEKKEQRTTW
jgi:hypothetical protein